MYNNMYHTKFSEYHHNNVLQFINMQCTPESEEIRCTCVYIT